MENIRARFLLGRLRDVFTDEPEWRLLRAIRFVDSSVKGDETWPEYLESITQSLSANGHPHPNLGCVLNGGGEARWREASTRWGYGAPRLGGGQCSEG